MSRDSNPMSRVQKPTVGPGRQLPPGAQLHNWGSFPISPPKWPRGEEDKHTPAWRRVCGVNKGVHNGSEDWATIVMKANPTSYQLGSGRGQRSRAHSDKDQSKCTYDKWQHLLWNFKTKKTFVHLEQAGPCKRWIHRNTVHYWIASQLDWDLCSSCKVFNSTSLRKRSN